MQRFELDGDIWDIAQTGAQLEITSAGKTAIRKFVSEAHARVQYDKLIAAKLAAGYREIAVVIAPVITAPPVAYARNLELEQAILDEPNDPNAYQVYADWLDRAGDPRGELIALQVATAANPRDVAIKKAIEKVFARHTDVLLGPLEPLEAALEWKHGFIHHLRLEPDKVNVSLCDAIEMVLAHSSGRFLAELTIRSDDYGEIDELIDMLTRTPMRALRSFELVTGVDIESMAAVWPLMPRLRRLCMKGRRGRSPLRRACVRSIAVAAWPALEKLELRFTTGDEVALVEDIAPLLQRVDLPALTHLRLRDIEEGDALCAELVTSPLVAQLQVLDLGMCNVTTAGRQRLFDNAARFAQLRELWLRRQTFRIEPDLKTVFKRVVDSDSDVDDHRVVQSERYGAIRE